MYFVRYSRGTVPKVTKAHVGILATSGHKEVGNTEIKMGDWDVSLCWK